MSTVFDRRSVNLNQCVYKGDCCLHVPLGRKLFPTCIPGSNTQVSNGISGFFYLTYAILAKPVLWACLTQISFPTEKCVRNDGKEGLEFEKLAAEPQISLCNSCLEHLLLNCVHRIH